MRPLEEKGRRPDSAGASDPSGDASETSALGDRVPIGQGADGTDERMRTVGILHRLMKRPEFGAVAGAVIVWITFAVLAGDRGFLTLRGTASYLEVAAQIGIIGAAASMLIIAGEFDLSVGSMVGASGMIIAVGVSVMEWEPWLAVAVGFGFALLVGFLQGLIVVRTGIPSFLVTLAGLFVLRGVALAIPRTLTGRTTVGGIAERVENSWVDAIFTADILGFKVVIVWWIGLALLGSWVLRRTRFGNWMYGIGGSLQAAKNLGVPANRVKVILFMVTAFSAALLAATQVFGVGSADANRGVLKELEAIITASIGGTFLMGGYGSVIGTIFGALTLGLTKQGLFFVAINSEWYSVSLGLLLLVAVFVNEYVRKRALGTR